MSRDLILVALSLMTWGVGEGIFFYFQPVYLSQLGANPITIGVVLGAAGIMMTIAHIPAGYLSDRVGRRPLMFASWITGMLSTWIMAISEGLSLFVIGLLMYSLTVFVVSPLNSYITAARGKLSISRSLTFISAFYNSGAILGPLIGGTIASQFGLRTIYFVSATILVVSVVIILFIRPQPVDKSSSDPDHHRFTINKRYALYLAIVFIAMFSTYLPQPLTPNFMQDQHSINLEDLGRLGSIASVGVVVIIIVLGSLPSQIGFILAQICVAIFSLLIWQGRSMVWFSLGYFLLGGYRAARVLAAAQTRSLVSQSNMGFAYGITESIGTSAIVIAPPIAGYLYTYNPTLVYRFSVYLIIGSIIASLFFYFHKSQLSSDPRQVK